MSVIKRQIWVTQHLRIPPIDIVQGSQVSIALQLMDYEIPSGAAANAYARGKNTITTYRSPCTISGDTVSFTPPDGFFIPGLNLLQIEINGAIIPFSINVNCEGRLSDSGESAPPEQVRPLVERAVTAAATAEAARNDASGFATKAAGSANAAKSSATNAKASEEAAETAAATAANDANAVVAPLVEQAQQAAADAEAALNQVPEAASTTVQPFAERAEQAAATAETAAADANAALAQVPANATAAVSPFADRAEAAAARAEQALETMETNYQDVGELQIKLKSGKIEDSELHLGFYLDEDGKLRPKERAINMGGQPITGLPWPVAHSDAVGKVYVDEGITGANAYSAGLHVRNLLDNSDFTNPVAQAGVGGNHGTVSYAADRWILDSGTVSVEVGVGMTLNGTIRQKLEFPPTGAVSAFVGMASGEATISYANGEVTVTSAGGVLKWAALYEGTYTKETRPPYVPKGYGAELAECQRYYCYYSSVSIPGFVSGAAKQYIMMLTLPVPMRVVPTVVGNPTWRARIAVGGYSKYTGNDETQFTDIVIGTYGNIIRIEDHVQTAYDTNNSLLFYLLHGLELSADL